MKNFLLIIGITAGIWITGYSLKYLLPLNAVIENPQQVKPLSPLHGEIEEVLINGKAWPIENSDYNLFLRSPRAKLAGVWEVVTGIGYENEKEDAHVGFSLFLPKSNAASEIKIAGFGLSIDDLLTDTLYADKGYRIDLWQECPLGNGEPYGDPNDYPKVSLVPRGPVTLKQEKKHLTLKGTFDIPPTQIPADPYMICDGTSSDTAGPLYRNPEPPVTIEVRGITLDIDTDLVFRWCGKGGDCYEL